MGIPVTCEFCGTDRLGANTSCESCGAKSNQPQVQSRKSKVETDGFVQAISQLLKDAQKSRLYLTGAALLFAVLFGVFWQKSQSSTPSPEIASQSFSHSKQALMLASIPVATGVFEKKAIFASAMMDISILNTIIHEHYLDTGKFPERMRDLKLDEGAMVSRNVEGLQIEKKGVILVQLTQSIGSNMHVKLVPELIMDGYNLQWNCFSNLPSNVLAGTRCESI